jgi:hypothetical protein
LGIYRVHGSNFWAGKQRRLEETDGTYKAARYLLVKEEKLAHANEVLRRAGRPVRLSPFLSSAYVKLYCQVHSVSLLSCLPAVLRASLTTNSLGRVGTFLQGLDIVRGIVKHCLRR